MPANTPLPFLAAVIFAFCLALGAQPIQARETLIPLIDCPNTGRHQACLRIQFDVLDGEPSGLIETVNNVDGTITQLVSLKGRLEGRKPSLFRLKLARHDALLDAQSKLGPLAYLGRSKRNHPIVLTSDGPLEIMTSAIDAAYQNGLVVVDEQRQQIVGAYFETFGDQFVVMPTHTISVWDSARGICVSAPRKVAGALTITTSTCKAVGLPREAEAISGSVAPYGGDPLSELALARLAVPALLYDGSATVSQIPDTTLVVVIPHFLRGT